MIFPRTHRLNRCLSFVLISFLVIFAIRGFADPIACGDRTTIHSKILGEDRTVFISLPPSYAQGTQRYPVLYLTDAQLQFDHAGTSAAFLARNGLIPEVIVVGVTNPDRTRDLYATKADFKFNGRTIPFPTSGNADQFIEFLEEELIPRVESTYRAVPLRILAGYSAGGNFALHTMRAKPGLFQAIIAGSPWLAWDEAKELKLLAPFLEGTGVKAQALFISYANDGSEMQANVEKLISALRARKDASLRWTSATYPDESHESSVIKSYYDGFRAIFRDWSYPRDPQTNFLIGSLDDVKAHYARYGERLGYTQLPPEGIVNELGYQLLGMKAIDKALATFRYNTEVYPQSANVWDSLADGLEKAGNIDDALASCRKAISIGEANRDPNIEHYQKHATRLAGPKKPDGK